jgi:hypothetical protein
MHCIFCRENLKHIFTVPETVAKTLECIEEGKLLQVSKCSIYKTYRKGFVIDFKQRSSVANPHHFRGDLQCLAFHLYADSDLAFHISKLKLYCGHHTPGIRLIYR